MTNLSKQQCAAVYSGKRCQLDAQHTGRHLRQLDSGQRLEWWEGEALTSKLCNCLDNECHAVPGWTCRKKIMGPDHADEQGVEVVCEAGSSLTPSGAPVRAKAVEPDRSRLLTSNEETLVRHVCTAYESGFGHGLDGRDLGNPYVPLSSAWEAYRYGYDQGLRKRSASETKALPPLCDGAVQVIYEHGEPTGVRDATGYLCFFNRVTKWPGQEERYRKELALRARYAEVIANALRSAQETERELTLKDFGYAPGNYTCKCLDCDQEFVGDKRASRCETCAAQALRENRSGAQKTTPPPCVWRTGCKDAKRCAEAGCCCGLQSTASGPKPDAEKAPVTSTEMCPTWDQVQHKEHNGKCVYCGAPMPSEKASEQECRSAGPSGNAAGTGPVDPGAEARSSRREVTAQKASVNPYCLQDGVPCASDGRGGCLACVDEKGTLNGKAPQ